MNERDNNTPKGLRDQKSEKARHRPLRDDVKDIDQQILRLLLRRYNLLEKMRQKGRLSAADDKFLRAEWQQSATRISKDANLSGRFFSMMQELKFLPPQKAGDKTEEVKERRTAYNLTPPRIAIDLDMQAPVDSNLTRCWLYLGAASGQSLSLANCLQNSDIISFARALEQLGAPITIQDDKIDIAAGQPISYADKALFIGGSPFNFYLCVAHYLGHHSRVKIIGETDLNLDLTDLRHLLPDLGARLIHIVPKSDGLPARLECSGMLPPGIKIPASVSGQFAEALLLAASFYDSPFAVDIRDHPEKELIIEHILPLLEACGATFVADNRTFNFEPSQIKIPQKPELPIDNYLAPFLLALSQPLTGTVNLRGLWKNWTSVQPLLKILAELNVNWQIESASISSKVQKALSTFNLFSTPDVLAQEALEGYTPLLVSLAACAALNDGEAILPAMLMDDEDVADFLRAANLAMDEEGKLYIIADSGSVWNAPSAEWAAALAVAACARKCKTGFQLGNPNIMNNLWPGFWSCYNNLHKPETEEKKETKSRRRIITDAVAVPPEIKEEDWDM